MEYFKEYPIRCKTCNEQLACYSADFEQYLANGSTIEEALNYIGIMNPCSRIAMANPTIVSFNMENREVIEGFKSVEAADENDAQNESQARPVFSSCLGTTAPHQTVKPIINLPVVTPYTRVAPSIQAPVLTQQRTVSGIQTISLMQPSIQRTQQTFGLPKEPIQQEQPLLVQPILPIDDTLPIGIGIPINVPIPNTESLLSSLN